MLYVLTIVLMVLNITMLVMTLSWSKVWPLIQPWAERPLRSMLWTLKVSWEEKRLVRVRWEPLPEEDGQALGRMLRDMLDRGDVHETKGVFTFKVKEGDLEKYKD